MRIAGHRWSWCQTQPGVEECRRFSLKMINQNSPSGRVVFTELTNHFTQGNVLDIIDETGDVDDVGLITLLVRSKLYIPSRDQPQQ